LGSFIKRKFGNNLRTKTIVGNTNEILCKAVCHNICVLIQEINEMGVNPELMQGSNKTLQIAKEVVNSGGTPKCAGGYLAQKEGFETQTCAPFLCKVPNNEKYIKVMTLS